MDGIPLRPHAHADVDQDRAGGLVHLRDVDGHGLGQHGGARHGRDAAGLHLHSARAAQSRARADARRHQAMTPEHRCGAATPPREGPGQDPSTLEEAQ